MAVIDIFSYNSEKDLLEIRFNILNDLVDEFIIVEAPTTFSGSLKPIYFDPVDFPEWTHKVRHFVVDERYSDEEIKQAHDSPYTNGQERWMREFMQKESIKKAMTHLQDDDICYIGDVDEIWELREYKDIEKLKLRVYAYYLNYRSTEEFWGTIRCKYKDIKDECLNNVRNNIMFRTFDYQGWHFTNQGGLDAVKKKITDQYNTELFNAKLIKEGVDEHFGKDDFIGRDFDFKVEEPGLPTYLLQNKDKYAKLFK